MSLFKRGKKEDFVFEENVIYNQPKIAQNAPHALSSEEILQSFEKSEPVIDHSALESLKKKVTKNDSEPPLKKEEEPTLVNKCKPFLTEEDGTDVSTKNVPLYKLESVAEILKSESNKALEELSKKYDLIFEDLQTKQPEVQTTEEVKEVEVKKGIENKVTNIQSNIPIVISDIDATPEPEKPIADIGNTATITFTPISSDDTTKKISVSTRTMPIDLTGELVKLPAMVEETEETDGMLEKNEFDEYVPKLEYKSVADGPKLRRLFSIIKRNSFISCIISFLVCLVILLFEIPQLSDFVTAHIFVGNIILSSFYFISIIANIDMFKSFSSIFRKKSESDVLPATASLFVLAYSLVAIITSKSITDLLVLSSFILFFRAVTKFKYFSSMLTNLKIVTSQNTKTAVKLLGDSAITSSMAKNAIDGDVLISAAQKTEFVEDFMKYSTFGKFLGGKLPVISIISILLSILLGVSASIYFEDNTFGLYAASVVQLLCSLPCLFFINVLPFSSATKKTSKIGAVIAGKTGAEQLEMSNAVVLSSNDFFPKGTITLHQMKILSENNLEDTIIRAASLTEYIGSTLAPIFKNIAKSGNVSVLPDADTVKYEERLGVSGWVDNRLLFIGNRTLMETHGISVPDVEVDRKILRSGYFPVYVATREKACALLVIQYNVETKTASELHKLSRLGVTILVNNTDPNITEEMLCDYFGLYDDTVKIMSAAGSYIHKNATVPIDKISCPAMFKGEKAFLPTLINCASKIKRSNTILTIMYVLSSILGILGFAYTSFGASGEMLNQTAVLLYSLITTVISYIIYLTEKP